MSIPSPEQIAEMQRVWSALGQDGQHALVERFYSHLFRQHPAMRASFPDLDAQHARFWASLDRVITTLGSKPDVVADVLQKLGAAHVRYGVDEAQVGLVKAIFRAELDDMGALHVFEPLLIYIFDHFYMGLVAERARSYSPPNLRVVEPQDGSVEWGERGKRLGMILGLCLLFTLGMTAAGMLLAGLLLDM